MATFPKPQQPLLTTRITLALKQLRAARKDGQPSLIHLAQRHLDRLIDQYPTPTAQEKPCPSP